MLAIATSIALPVRADVRASRRDTILQASERAARRGDRQGALRRLKAALATPAPDAALLLAYARLALPLAVPATREPLDQHAAYYLARLGLAAPADDARVTHGLWLHAAWAAALLGRFDESLAAVRETGALQDAETLLCLRLIAITAVRRERLDVAENALMMARQYMPQDVATMAEFGAVLLARGRAESAVSQLAERLAIAPGELAARRDLAYALSAAGRPEQALGLLRGADACEREPGCALEAARIALEAGDAEAAVRYAELRLVALPDDLDALYVSADGHARQGRFDAARVQWGRVLQLRPDSARAKQALAELPASSNAPPP